MLNAAWISQSARFFALVLFIALATLLIIVTSPQLESISAQQIIEPRWVNIPYPSGYGTYTRLHNGSVLRAGGGSVSAEIFSPLTGQWRLTGQMVIPRGGHDTFLLPDGRILVIGGLLSNQFPLIVYAGPPEIYDPVSESWRLVELSGGVLSNNYNIGGVKLAVSTLMKNGKIFMINGATLPIGFHSIIFDPDTGIVEDGPPFPQELGSFQNEIRPLIPLFDGRVLYSIQGKTLLYDPDENTWTAYSFPDNLNFEAAYWRFLLSDGSLIASLGRKDVNSNTIAYSSGIFNILTGQWKESIESESVTSNSTVLTDGKVVSIYDYQSTASVFDPATDTSKPVTNTITSAQRNPTVFLADGRLLSGTRMYGYDFDHSFTSATAVSVSAASFRAEPLARGSLASLFCSDLPQKTPQQHYLMYIRDSSGTNHEVFRFYGANYNQLNYLLPDDIPTGQAELQLILGGKVLYALMSIVDSSPGLFTVNATGQGMPAAVALRVRADGSQSYEPITDGINLGDSGDRVFIVLFGTGIRHRILRDEYAFAYLDRVRANVLYAGKNGADYEGLDQVNIEIPRSLAGRGDVDLLLTIDGRTANPVTLRIN